MHPLKVYLITLIIACVVPAAYAQFDDVYYNPDDYVPKAYKSTGNARYIDNEANATYYDDYDYYYSSRIKRFYNPSYSSGFGFYDPYFVDAHYYDPYYSNAYYPNAYYYPGASIYYNYGGNGCGGNWGNGPSIHSMSSNVWYAGSSNHWGISDGCTSYADYYNNYYNSCPSPVTNYYGITNVYIDRTGGRGTYYGPRITGTSGSSPRGPLFNSPIAQPVYVANNGAQVRNNGTPKESGPVLNPIRSNPSSSAQPGVDKSPEVVSNGNAENPRGIGKDVPVDVELNKNESRPGSRRPVFKPDTEEIKPYPGSDKGTAAQDHSGMSPERGSTRPAYQPSSDEVVERPRYTPPQRDNTSSGNENRPSPSSQRSDESRNNDKPSYSPPTRSNDSGRSNDRPSYSPPSRDNSSGGSSSRPDSGRSSSPSSSSGSSGSPRSSGGRG